MVPNPPLHLKGDFALNEDGKLALDGEPRFTFGKIGLYDTRMFRDLALGMQRALMPTIVKPSRRDARQANFTKTAGKTSARPLSFRHSTKNCAAAERPAFRNRFGTHPMIKYTVLPFFPSCCVSQSCPIPVPILSSR